MSLEYKILGQELVSYTDVEGTDDTTSYYVSYEETRSPIFVAVGASSTSRYAYSLDGLSWSLSNFPGNRFWYLVAYGADKFVALGSFNTASAISDDGITWTFSTPPTHPFGASFNSLSYLGGKFIGATSDGYIAHSVDGMNWSVNYSGYNVDIRSLAYGNGRMVAVTVNSSIFLYSDNLGEDWASTPSPSNGLWMSSIYGGDKFVAVALFSSTAAYSTDGVTWQLSDDLFGGAELWQSVTHGNGIFVTVANNSTTSSNYSTDGITWQPGDLSTNRWKPVTYGDGKFVALAATGFDAETVAAYSLDGANWVENVLPASFDSKNSQWESIVYGQQIALAETLNIIGGQGTSATEEFLPITIYTVPEEKQTTVTSIFVANHDETDSTYDLAVIPAGEELSLKHHIRWDMAVAAKDFENISTKITMSAGDKLVIFPATVDTVSITAFGVEK